jgi:hypothetical protein
MTLRESVRPDELSGRHSIIYGLDLLCFMAYLMDVPFFASSHAQTVRPADHWRGDLNARDPGQEHMEVIGADGVHIGTVDRVENGRIKLTKADSGEGRHRGHHHFIDLALVADVEGQKVRLSANAAVAVTMEEEQSPKPV